MTPQEPLLLPRRLSLEKHSEDFNRRVQPKLLRALPPVVAGNAD